MKIVLPKHIKLQIEERNISEDLVKETLANPDQLIEGTKGKKVAQKKYFDSLRNREYLIRVIFREEKGSKIGVTAYKTSKIKKYWR